MIIIGSAGSNSSFIASHPATILTRILAGTIGVQATKGVGIKGAVIVIQIIAVTTGTIVTIITVADAGRTMGGATLTPGPRHMKKVAAETLTAVRQVAESPREVHHPLLKRTGWNIPPAGDPSLATTPNDRAPQKRQILFTLVELNIEVT